MASSAPEGGAGAAAPAPNAPYDLGIDRPVTYTPHQRGTTCMTDAIETILCYADVIRHIILDPFQRWLTVEKAEALTDFYEPYLQLIRDQYGNSPYIKNILIRYIQRQKLPVEAPANRKNRPAGLKRTPSVNGTRGNMARLAWNEDIMRVEPTVFRVRQHRIIAQECPIANVTLLKQLLPGINVFTKTDIVLQADWKEKLVAVKFSLGLLPDYFHAACFIRNNGRWYFCEDSFGYAFEVPIQFVEHLLHSLILGRLVEYDVNNAVGINLNVQYATILQLSKKSSANAILTGVGSYLYQSTSHLKSESNDKFGFKNIVESHDFVYFFEESDAPLLTEEDRARMEDHADEIALDLWASQPESPGMKWTTMFEAIKRGDEGTAIRYIREGTDLRIREGSRKLTALALACEKGLRGVVEAILESDRLKNVNYEDKYENTPLLLACRHDDVEIVRLLLQHGATAKVNHRNQYGETALCVACKLKNANVALFLINDIEGVDLNLGNPLSLIEEEDAHMRVVKDALLAKGVDPEAETLYQYGNNSNEASSRKLARAIYSKDVHAALQYIKDGAKLTDQVIVASPRLEAVALAVLEKPGVNPNATYKGDSVIGDATIFGSLPVVNRLLELKANPDGKHQGKSALFWACRIYREDIALKLIEAGADVKSENLLQLMFRGDRMPAVKAALLAKGATDSGAPAAPVTAAPVGEQVNNSEIHLPGTSRHRKTRKTSRSRTLYRRSNRKSRRNRR
jgi:ankyrin repeat protein